MKQPYDSVLLVSFGGPEGPADVLPFLENVLRGRNVPRERMLKVAEHYQHFGGVSPLNAQNRALAEALRRELAVNQIDLPVYLGNRNWHPLLAETLERMAQEGRRRALGFFTSAYSSYSSCRQYLENIAWAREEIGPAAPVVDKLRAFFNHPLFIEATAEQVRAAIHRVPAGSRARAHVIYTAHSIPLAMARNCRYEVQLAEASRLVSEQLGLTSYELAYQSRSGPPEQPWLEPDIGQAFKKVHAAGRAKDIVIAPIGFLSDHIEILWDLDTEAKSLCDSLGLNMVRADTVGSHPKFVQMIRRLILERTTGAPKLAIGQFGPSHDECLADCCAYSPKRP